MRLAFLGVAHMHAHAYAAALGTLPEVTLVGVYDDATQAQGVAKRYGVPFFEDAETLLAQGLDGVIICAETIKHRPLVELAAGKTKHILCEKPIATTLTDARAMLEVCTRKSTQLHIAFPMRFSPPVQRLKALLEADTLGTLYSASCTNHGRMPGGWFLDRALSGGGAVIDHTVHVIDLLRWLLQTEVSEVYAEVGYGLLHEETDIDDAGLLSFRLANGVYGTLDTSWSRPQSYPTWGDVKLELLGERGAVRIDAFNQTLTLTSDTTGKSDVPWGSDADLGLIRDFVQRITSDRPPTITGFDGLKALEVALAAYRSDQTSTPVTLTHDTHS